MTFSFKLGDRSDAVREIKRKLAINSSQPEFRAQECTGEYDEKTKEAVRAFQAKHGIKPESGICDEATWNRLNEEAGSVFAETWQYELASLRLGGNPKDIRIRPVFDEAKLIKDVHAANMAGLALSGGGIRSATFNLGVLQALAELKLLRRFDYLSTVSGGGYIGAWFSKWLKREGGNIDLVEEELSPGPRTDNTARREAGEVRFLRQYSNYLTAKTGFFSADTWAVLSTYFRNTLLNLSILFAVMAAVMILPRVLVLAVQSGKWLVAPVTFLKVSLPAAGAWAILFALWAVFWIAISISTIPDPAKSKWIRGQSQRSIIGGIVVPLLVAAFMGSIALWHERATVSEAWMQLIAEPTWDKQLLHWVIAPGFIYFLVWAAGWLVAHMWNRRAKHRTKAEARGLLRFTKRAVWEGAGHLMCAVVAFSIGALLVTLTTAAIAAWTTQAASDITALTHVVVLGMPILLGLFGVTMVLSVGLVGRMYSEKSREWWSRQGGWTMIFLIAWLGLAAVSLYGMQAVAYVAEGAPGWVGGLLASAWLGTTLVGVLLGNSSATGKKRPSRVLEFIAVAAPYVFSVGALLGVSALVGILMEPIWSRLDRLWMVPIFLLAAGFLLAWRVDINKFSLHMMYRNRLVRAYLGASNTQRRPHPFTGFDECDDINVEELLAPANKIQRPFHILNATLNLVGGKELAWQARKAANFTFTPAFCGFELPSVAAPGLNKMAKTASEAMRGSYRATKSYRAHLPPDDDEGGIKLGMAVAVSGAAATPNMGYHSSPALSFLMTLFNVRLGRWFANPLAGGKKRGSTSPKVGLLRLLDELFGRTDSSADFLYLSDGGHFENLGVYELVRRRCRLILVVDASADCDLNFDDLGNAIRKCATDLQIDIDLDARKIGLQVQSEFSEAHFAVGTIQYNKVDPGAPNGTLLYIKPSLLGTECAELLNYRKSNAAFPHDATADQWFDETQFESYRSLGYRIGKLVLEKPAAAAPDIEALCAQLQQRWVARGSDRRAA